MEPILTDKSFGIPSMRDKFRNIRTLSKREHERIYSKRKKDKSIPVPKYKIDDEIVIISRGIRTREYMKVQIIDFESNYFGSFSYYSIVLKVTEKCMVDRIGRLVKFNEEPNFLESCPAKVEDKNIYWKE